MQAGFFPTESLAHEWLTYIKQHDHPIKLLLSTSSHLSESLSNLRKVLPREPSPLVGSVPENQNRKGLGHQPQPSAGVCTVGCGETRHWTSFWVIYTQFPVSHWEPILALGGKT